MRRNAENAALIGLQASEMPRQLRPIFVFQRKYFEVPDKIDAQPRNGSWTDVSVRFSGFPARRDVAATSTLQGGATPQRSLKNVQSHS